MTEAQVVAEVNRIVGLLANSFRFGYYDADDIKQEAWIEAIKGLENYDESRKLDSFLYTHIKNRLINLKRNKFKRPNSPCKYCHGQPENHTTHKDNKHCKKYKRWLVRNTAKQNLMAPKPIINVSPAQFISKNLDNIEDREIFDRIEAHLDPHMRKIYLKVLYETPVSKRDREHLVEKVREILCLENQS